MISDRYIKIANGSQETSVWTRVAAFYIANPKNLTFARENKYAPHSLYKYFSLRLSVT